MSSATRSGFAMIEPTIEAKITSSGPSKPVRRNADAGIDEQRRTPADEKQDDQQAVGLELERQVSGQRVAADRDEEDDEDQAREQARPADVPRTDQRHERGQHARRRRRHGRRMPLVTDTAKKTSDASTAAAGRIVRAGGASGTVKLLTWLRGSASYGAVVRHRGGLARAWRAAADSRAGRRARRSRTSPRGRSRSASSSSEPGRSWHRVAAAPARRERGPCRDVVGLLVPLEIRLERGRAPQGELHRVTAASSRWQRCR